jgi:hypothetical protein
MLKEKIVIREAVKKQNLEGVFDKDPLFEKVKDKLFRL